MAVCKDCGKDVLRIQLIQGSCLKCIEAAAEAEAAKAKEAREAAARDEAAKSAAFNAALSNIILTTETAHNLPVAERVDIITAEVVIGMSMFKDLAAGARDIFGGRSKAMQDGLREARRAALTELRREAYHLGADAVVGVDLDYSEISGGGKSMLFLVASGTAVKLHPPA